MNLVRCWRKPSGAESRSSLETIDRLASRFEQASDSGQGLYTSELTDLVRESGATADRLANLVRAGQASLDDGSITAMSQSAEHAATAVIDRLLWGIAGLIVLVALSQVMVRRLVRRA